MTSPQSLVVRTFTDRAEGLSHFVLRAGEAPRLARLRRRAGLPGRNRPGRPGMDRSGRHPARRRPAPRRPAHQRDRGGGGRAEGGRRPPVRLPGPAAGCPADGRLRGAILFDEPGVKAVEFSHRAHALAHFLRATAGAGALLAMLGRRAPELRHLRRWLGPIIQELDGPRPLVAGWFAASSAGCLSRRWIRRSPTGISRWDSSRRLSTLNMWIHISTNLWTETVAPWVRQGLGIHKFSPRRCCNPNKIRHLRALSRSVF